MQIEQEAPRSLHASTGDKTQGPHAELSGAAFLAQHRASLAPFVEAGRMTPAEADACSRMAHDYMEQCRRGCAGIEWDQVEPLSNAESLNIVKGLESIDAREASSLLSEVVMLRLNGGLGTSMGCEGPKALIEVAHGKSFLELVLRQAASLGASHGVQLPVVFMNSDRTDRLTRRAVSDALEKLKAEGRSEKEIGINFFEQPVFPRLNPETYFPSTELMDALNGEEEDLWYPPGHGCVFRSFVESGLAQEFLNAGKRWVFVANVDNLGAWPDPRILSAIENIVETKKANGLQPPVFFMETTKKTQLDVKGGAPILYKKKPFLLEAVQVPQGHQKDFEDIERFELFNTGNLWIDLEAWVHLPPLSLPIIPNPKTVVAPATGKSVKVLQLETGVGTALSVLPSYVLVVSRKRFIPVKLTADLLRLRSDLYTIDPKTGFLETQVEYGTNLPEVSLSREFAHVQDLEMRVRGNVSLKDVKRLVLDGNIVLEDGVKFIGDVEIHSHREQALELGTIYVDVKIE